MQGESLPPPEPAGSTASHAIVDVIAEQALLVSSSSASAPSEALLTTTAATSTAAISTDASDLNQLLAEPHSGSDAAAADDAGDTSTSAAATAAAAAAEQLRHEEPGGTKQAVGQTSTAVQAAAVAAAAISNSSQSESPTGVPRSSVSSRRTSRNRVGESPPVQQCSSSPGDAAALASQLQPQLQQQQQQQQPGISLHTASTTTTSAAAATGGQPEAGLGLATGQPCGVMAPAYHKSASSSILSLHIHGTSQLVPDLLLTDPVVRLHVVHAATGEYIHMRQQLKDPTQQQQQQQKEQQHQYKQQQPGHPLKQGGGSCTPVTRQPVSSNTHAELLDYPGRPAMSTLDNNTAEPKAALLQHIPPVQTRPFSMTSSCSSSTTTCEVAGNSSGSSRGGLSAAWEEELCVDAAPEKLIDGDALLLLELLQLPGGFARYKRHAGDFAKQGGCHPVAWAFLRLSGLQRTQLQQGQQPLKLRLQLYQYSTGAVRAEGLLSPRLAVPHPATPAKAAYLTFKLSGFLSPTTHSTTTTTTAPQAAATTIAAPFNAQHLPPTQPESSSSNLIAVTRPGAAATTSSSSSPWRVGLWTPWASSSEGSGSPGVQTRLSQQALAATAAAAAVSKYPAYIEVTLAAVPRPSGVVVVTDPAAGIRPALPAGYGSGFEIGRMPVSLLYMPRAMRGAARGGSAGGMMYNSSGGAAGGGMSAEDSFGPGGLMDEALLLLESKLHRPHTHPCQVPNALLAEIKSTSAGCSAISISRDGRWLAAACGDDKGRFQVVLYQALTGRLCWVLGSHSGMVHSISWAKDDSSFVTASADFTAKVWHLPVLPVPLPGGSQQQHHQQQHQRQQPGFFPQQYSDGGGGGGGGGQQWGMMPCNSSSNSNSANGHQPTTAAGQAPQHDSIDSFAAAGLGFTAASSLGATAAAAGVSVSILQHTCFVYAAELHPMLKPLQTVVTAGFDGVLRLWSMEGVVLYSLLVSQVPVNCLAFDQLGTRLFAGDAAGGLTELSLDFTPLLASAAGAGATGAVLFSAAGAAACLHTAPSSAFDQLHTQPASDAVGSSSGGGGSSSSNGSTDPTLQQQTTGTSAAGMTSSAAVVASVLRHGSAATQQLAGAQLVKKLRVSQELAGCPLMSLMCHPGGHHLVAVARSPKGVSDLVALDAKLLLVARRFTGIRCSNAPIKFALSPDGQYVLCGSEDGTAMIWDFATATPTHMQHMELGHAPIHGMAWSSCFQAVAVCSFSHYAPIRVLGFAPDQQPVRLNPPCASSTQRHSHQGKEALDASTVWNSNSMNRPAARCPLPDQLTPAHVHALLSDLRLSASQRGLYSRPADPHGQQLMVQAQRHQQHLPHRRLGSSRPVTADGRAAAVARSSSAAAGSTKDSGFLGPVPGCRQQGAPQGLVAPGALQVGTESTPLDLMAKAVQNSSSSSMLGSKVECLQGTGLLTQQSQQQVEQVTTTPKQQEQLLSAAGTSRPTAAPWQM